MLVPFFYFGGWIMKKKFFLMLLTLLVFLNFVVRPPSSYAFGIDTAVKIVAGSSAKQLVRGMAERVGLKLSGKQLDNTVSYINRKAYDGDPKAVRFVTDISSKTATTGGKSGFKKYLLDPMLWISGLDLVFEAYNAFKGAFDSEGTVPVMNYTNLMCVQPGVDGTNSTSVQVWVKEGTTNYSGQQDTSMGGSRYDTYTCTVMKVKGFPESQIYQVDVSILDVTTGYTKILTALNLGITAGNPPNRTFNTYSEPSTYKPVASDVPDISQVDSTVNNYFLDNTYNSTTNYYLPVEIPENVDNDDGAVWNDKDPQVPVELKPPKGTDPVTPVPEPEDKPVGSSWWEWLLKPLIAVIKGISDLIGGLVGLLLDGLKALFVPSQSSVQGIFDGIKTDFDAKLPLIGQLGGFFDSIKSSSTGDGKTPKFEMTMPPEYGGGKYQIIDFAYFASYQVWVLNFIRFSAWFMFLKRLYNRIPRMIY